MIERVVEQALLSQASRTIVATDDRRISEVLAATGVEVILTSPDHASGSDRIWEAVEHLQLGTDAVLVNVQGDEPLIPPEVINQVALLHSGESQLGVATLCEPLQSFAEVVNPNFVKVVRDKSSRALYFSRAPIPWERDTFAHANKRNVVTNCFRHLGIYSYRKWALERFVHLPIGDLERLESLEQLRFIENGLGIAVAEAVERVPGGVDTPEDVERVVHFLESSGS